ncbi:MAG TPA: M1 family aminopeptidase, partial [Chitinophagaceae bacterium]|nr:M1 family aminopeptidase [Chitinophagaceae bacterium]
LVLVLGGYIFYNTNVLNEYSTTSSGLKKQAAYEQKYSRYKNLPQPRLADVKLQVETYPEQRKAIVKGIYLLVNNTSVAIDSIHLELQAAKVRGITFNRASKKVITDNELDHHIYVLAKPLQPGDSVQMNFDVNFERKGFTNYGINPAVTANGTYFTSVDWFPVIGYQWSREIFKPTERRRYGLSARPLVASPYEIESQVDGPGSGRLTVETVISTDADQIAVAPGILQRTWTKDGRRYFSYATGTSIGSEYALFSAKYALREDHWQSSDTNHSVLIQVFYHPAHNANVERIIKSAKASLEYYSKQFGEYPHDHLSFVEHPGRGHGMHAEPAMITMEEGFSLFNPDADKRSIDLPYAVVGHEVAHQWWGGLVAYAPVQGAGLLTESPAWYSSMRMINASYGPEHLQRLLEFMRQPYPILPIRSSVPLLRGLDPYSSYRRGPFALHALAQYMGEEKVNLAYRHLVEKYGTDAAPLVTSLDLYRELKAVTPDSLQTLLHDLFEANTFWDLKTERAVSKRTATGSWKVTLDVKAKKTVLSESGAEKELPMDEWVEIGVFSEDGRSLYLQKHKIHSGAQTITVTVNSQPGRAGIDPYNLLWGWERRWNVRDVKSK